MNTPISLLIVAASDGDAELLRRELRSGGYQPVMERVEAVAEMAAALDRQRWDAVLSELRLPGFSAQGALACLRERELDLPFIVVSDATGTDAAVALMKAGAHDCISKNNLSRLIPALERELRVVAAFQDINRLKQAEERLRASEERFRTLVQLGSDMIVVLDRQGTITYVSPSVERVMGYRPEDLIGRAVPFDLMHPDDSERLQRILAKVLTEPGPHKPLEFRFRHADGSWHYLETTANNLLHDPVVAGVVENIRDITERKRAEAERDLLLEREQAARAEAERSAEMVRRLLAISDVALAHLGLDELLGELLVRIREALAVDTLTVLLLTPDDREMVARAALGFDNATVPGLRIEVGRGVAGRVAESGRPAVVDDLSTVETAGPILRSRGVQSLVCVPLLIDGRVTGVVQAGSLRSRHFTGDEVQLLQLVADRAATAIERSQLYEAEQAARAEAEAVQQRVAFLAEASRRLAASLHYEATLTTVARLAVPTLADWCLVDVLEDGGSIRTVAAAHVDPAREPPLLNLRRQYTPDPSGDTPVARVLRIGESVLSPVLPDAAPEALARDAEHLALLRALGPSPISGMVVPLVSRGQTVGAISFAARESGRRYGPEDLALAEDLARRAAAAVDNALLYQETLAASARGHEHAARLRKLAEAALDVTSALTLGDRLQIITERARDIIGAHQAATDVVEGDHDGSRVSTVSLSDKDGAWRDNREPAIGSELTALVRTENRPRRLSEAELKQHPAWQGIGRQAETHPPMRGWLAAPLVGRDGRNLGLIQLSDRHDGEFTEEDEAILVQLAQMASAAIEHARLQQQASAAAAAVEADRLKTELLSTVSHELRTPLAAIKGFTTTMVAYFDRLVREDQLSFLREIDGAADRLHELVENLLRLSRLEAGTLDIRREPLALASVLVRSLEDARRRFLDRVITLELAGTLPAVRADARRIEQVVANLIDNAVKYSPEGGEVEIRARPSAAGGVEFSVTDHGIGIAAEHLERVFERFYRVDSSVTAEIGGTGLGLAICRRIVEAHGGAIAAASREGQGSTFTVTLPPA